MKNNKSLSVIHLSPKINECDFYEDGRVQFNPDDQIIVFTTGNKEYITQEERILDNSEDLKLIPQKYRKKFYDGEYFQIRIINETIVTYNPCI